MKNKTLLFAALVSVFGWCCISCEPNEPMNYIGKPFSVSDNKKVIFSQGNLQYTKLTHTWSFAAQQYEMIGEDNINGRKLAGKIDLFGWSGNIGAAKWGISTSMDNNDYSGDLADWGQNIGDGTIWRTLTKDEWEYVLFNRTNADTKKGAARINLDEAGTTYANGLILLPDTWNCPDGVIFTLGFYDNDYVHTEQDYADHQTFTLEQWKKLEAAGAVFLPASGCRRDQSVSSVQTGSIYWSATPYNSDVAYSLNFLFGGSHTSYRCIGLAVRLVRDL